METLKIVDVEVFKVMNGSKFQRLRITLEDGSSYTTLHGYKTLANARKKAKKELVGTVAIVGAWAASKKEFYVYQADILLAAYPKTFGDVTLHHSKLDAANSSYNNTVNQIKRQYTEYLQQNS